MQTYYDTSALIALYVVEEHTGAVEAHTAAAGVPIMIHHLHRLEAENGLRAKVFRKEMKEAQCREVLDRIERDIARGLLAPTAVRWGDAFREARRVSTLVTRHSGCRSLDALHIAVALHWECRLLISLDDRQIKAASLARLKVLDLRAP
ncbi:MAG: type II toxin-antitoxin system VapC family toxin [Acidobacteria bacterium]|nr:type II toxin-antitoxin system VapC family toxin [Acidobacteriota bacterium]